MTGWALVLRKWIICRGFKKKNSFFFFMLLTAKYYQHINMDLCVNINSIKNGLGTVLPIRSAPHLVPLNLPCVSTMCVVAVVPVVRWYHWRWPAGLTPLWFELPLHLGSDRAFHWREPPERSEVLSLRGTQTGHSSLVSSWVQSQLWFLCEDLTVV